MPPGWAEQSLSAEQALDMQYRTAFPFTPRGAQKAFDPWQSASVLHWSDAQTFISTG
jgi:hypothetical protein